MSARILVVDDDLTTRHLLRGLLRSAGYRVSVARDGREALRRVDRERFELMVLDVWMPRMDGLELLAHLRKKPGRPLVIVLTSDDTPQTVLRALREQACHYVSKPVEGEEFVDLVRRALANPPVSPEIEVVSAKPNWVELLVPCEREMADRIQAFLAHLESDLDAEVREKVGYAFRELLLNAVEWGGRLDATRKVRIACLRAGRMLLYRIADPGPGFRLDDLAHAAAGQPAESPLEHMRVREEKGLRPGGFGIVLVRAQVDELLYNEAGNEVVLIKYLD